MLKTDLTRPARPRLPALEKDGTPMRLRWASFFAGGDRRRPVLLLSLFRLCIQPPAVPCLWRGSAARGALTAWCPWHLLSLAYPGPGGRAAGMRLGLRICRLGSGEYPGRGTCRSRRPVRPTWRAPGVVGGHVAHGVSWSLPRSSRHHSLYCKYARATSENNRVYTLGNFPNPFALGDLRSGRGWAGGRGPGPARSAALR
jgi:hypothetical protein